MRVCPGLCDVRQGWILYLTAVAFLAVASSGWAAPRFGRSGTYAVDGAPIGLRAAAIDARGGIDLLTANEAGEEGPSLSFLYNRGSGSFFPEQRMELDAAAYAMQGVATGDFNADQRADLAVAVLDISAFPVRDAVLVYLNRGDGFAPPVVYSLAGLFPQCLEAVDVTGDDALDLVVCHSRSAGGSAQGVITVLAGQRSGATPTGAFEQVYDGVVGTAPAGVTGADVDGDGRADLVVVDPADQRVRILYGTAAPRRFEAPVVVDVVSDPLAALIDAVPGEPVPRLLVATSSTGRLLTYRQTAPRVFALPTVQRIALSPTAIARAPIDEDSAGDLVVLSALGAELWIGQADGGFAFGESLVEDPSLDSLAVADLDGDGRLDVAASASSENRVTVVLNSADVPFTPPPTALGTPTPSPTRSGVSTATPIGPGCPGDCDGNDMVTIDELIEGVNIALGNGGVETCPAFDLDRDRQVAVNELIAAVDSATNSCAAARAENLART
jgi:hypothetical protein